MILALGCAADSIFSRGERGRCEYCLLDRPTVSTAAAAESVQEGTATIEGRVIYEADKKRRWRFGRYYIRDRKKGYLAEAVVALNDSSLKDYAAPQQVDTRRIDQKDTRFVPETIAIRVGDRVTFTNSDPQVHNINSQSPLARFDETIGGGQQAEYTFQRAGGTRRPVVLGCKLHSAMQAWVFVFDHPFFQQTGADGKFRLENIPPGKYRLEMAHAAGSLRRSQTITVKSGDRLQVDIRVSPDHKLESVP